MHFNTGVLFSFFIQTKILVHMFCCQRLLSALPPVNKMLSIGKREEEQWSFEK